MKGLVLSLGKLQPALSLELILLHFREGPL